MKKWISAGAAFAFCVFAYWLAGGEFARGPWTAYLFCLSVSFAGWVGWWSA